jgi:sec-independent protein translocase protein TatA
MEYLVILGALGPTELILIALVVILLFGGRKIPELMKGIGEGMKEFKKASREGDMPAKTEVPSEKDNK